MTSIKIRSLSSGYDQQVHLLFDQVSLDLDDTWKLGITGDNGVGKTTFLKILSGEIPYQGQIQADQAFQYFPQPIEKSSDMPALFALQQLQFFEQWELERECELLKLRKELIWAPLSQLSGGELTKLLLALLFIDTTSFPLIDEPTNHLDKESREHVRDYLKAKQGYIVVSHDTDFMNAVCDHLLIIDQQIIKLYAGNFYDIIEQKALEEREVNDKNNRLAKEIDRLNDTAIEKKRWGSLRESDNKGRNIAARLNKRAKAIEQRKAREIEQKKQLMVKTTTTDSLTLSPQYAIREPLLLVEDFSLRYDQEWLFEPISFSIKNGDRIVLDGRNGSGKTSILEHIMGLGNAEQAGRVLSSENLTVSLIKQDYDTYKGSLQVFAEEQALDYTTFLNCLHKLGMERIVFETPIELMSMGQQKKVEVAKSLLTPAELFIWDEPLNYLDFRNREQLIETIEVYQPTLLFVEHDSGFQKIATQTVRIQPLSR
ncbi:hypothetical protein BAU15_07670 [Enterococcus sp. JM4C]|uniref:ribosomal protection-like ABC-F family protein n=1 Tax=Candidatus Enterococcus huntleyi TaxID=1857217 RepID=UPI001379C918|nr:ATP-binding cassette domain-containing protein [Enterococcus sp. JM4C]KAF1297581.1 hypothetical protein BAU15_07670 [Enterococcus sp. JM4C]